jgi:hypothetical protein
MKTTAILKLSKTGLSSCSYHIIGDASMTGGPASSGTERGEGG